MPKFHFVMSHVPLGASRRGQGFLSLLFDFVLPPVCAGETKIKSAQSKEEKVKMQNLACNQMKKTIEKILKAHGLLDRLQEENFAVRIENEPYITLSIDKHGDFISVTHYFEQNGDLVPDPDQEFKIMPNGSWCPVAIQFATGAYICASVFEDGKHLFKPRAAREQISFSNMLARNLIEQGFGRSNAQIQVLS